MAIPFFEEDMEIISKLGTRPKEENGVNESELKRLFDTAGIKIKKFLNETLIPQMNMTVDVQALLNGILDATLSKSDKAAPAKLVGDKIAEVVKTAGAALPRSGGAMTGGINMSNQKLTNVPTPSNEYDAANKKYVDNCKIATTIYLAADNWVDKTQVVENAAVTPNSIIFFGYAQESVDACRIADVRCAGQEKGKLYFTCKWVPRDAVFVEVVIWN